MNNKEIKNTFRIAAIFGDGIKKAEALDETTITRVAAVSGNDVIEGTFF